MSCPSRPAPRWGSCPGSGAIPRRCKHCLQPGTTPPPPPSVHSSPTPTAPACHPPITHAYSTGQPVPAAESRRLESREETITKERNYGIHVTSEEIYYEPAALHRPVPGSSNRYGDANHQTKARSNRIRANSPGRNPLEESRITPACAAADRGPTVWHHVLVR